MSKIKPFWRIVIGFIILCVCVYCTNMLSFGASWFAFAFWWALFVAYVFLAIKIKYDDPLRSMRDLLAQQAEANRPQQVEAKAELPAAGDDTPEIRMILTAARKMDSAKQKEMLRVLKAVFPEEFGGDK